MKEISKLKEQDIDLLLSTLECIGDGVIATDNEANIIYINQSAANLIGKDISDVYHKNLETEFRLANITNDKELVIPYKEVIKEKKSLGLKKDTVLVHSDGSIKYISAKISPISNANGEVVGVVIVFRDITRIRKNEVEQINQKNNFKAVFDNSPLGMVILDENIKVYNYNQVYRSTFAKDKDTIIGEYFGNTLKCLNAMGAQCGQGKGCPLCNIRKNLIKVLEKKKPYKDIISNYNTLVNNKQIEKWLKYDFVPINIGGNKKILVVIEDITEKKKIEKNMKNSMEMAEEANKLKSEFLANMSHEIRTPLNGLLGMIDLTLLTELNKDQRENLLIAKSSGNLLLKIINDILDFSKMEAKKLEIENRQFDIYKMIQELIKIHNKKANEKEIELNIMGINNIPQFVYGDLYRLNQILNNLIHNAIKFTEFGSVDIIVDMKESDNNKKELTFIIKDTGIGIREKDLGNLFKSFSQLDGSYTKKYSGTGLGLVISKQLVEMMGGHIWVESKIGIGSTFGFSIPILLGAGNTNLEEKIVLNPLEKCNKDKNYTILLVEDDMVNQQLVLKILGSKYNIITANNGLDAIEIYKKIKDIDLILMDIQMPLMDGIQVTNMIRDIYKDSIPIIALTAYALGGDKEKFLEYGVNDYISKPIDMNLLLYKINQVINQHKEKGNKDGKKTFNVKLSELEQIKEFIIELDKGMKDNNLDLIENRANVLKMEAIKIDADSIKNKAFKIELSIRRGDLEEAYYFINQLKDEYNNLINERDGYK
ncbi:PAS/PAC sensor hybrid histidine kinase [Natranaerovirga pectinivora]|uniref:Circadian input-output histidine kinase CikA n=1 Tax=Natranaerovirga pectinivora TaxID=682400 RepID=A0A4R3MG43_9FIRM|nr:ATP-binding protein [Natranaerovirga pectinivora]TCT12132.1 PAS/PAC sensor hybrid histidine kinase [Natranaerovirga pectinivora]